MKLNLDGKKAAYLMRRIYHVMQIVTNPKNLNRRHNNCVYKTLKTILIVL
jgi:hypothetical protein